MKRMNARRWMAMAGSVVAVAGVALVSQIVGQSAASASSVPNVVIKSSPVVFNSLTPKTAVALCPAGTRVIGGGGRVNGAQHVVITEQQPIHGSRDTFQVSAAEDQVGTNQSWAVQAYAACSSPVAGLVIVSVTGDAGSGGFQAKRADCPAGKSALGAGGRINNGAGQVALNTQGLGASISQATAASGLEDRDGFAGTWSVTAYAVCASLNSLFDAQLVTIQTASDTTARKILDVPCPAGMHVTGGAAFASFPGVVESVLPTIDRVQVIARQDGAVTPADQWAVTGYAFCAS